MQIYSHLQFLPTYNYALIISHCFWENVGQNIYYETSHVSLTV